jgi:ABC-type transporter Mla subunit MlaD
MAGDDNAQELASGLRSISRLATTLAEPDGPLMQALERIPPLLANLDQAAAGIPKVVAQADRAMTSVGDLVGGPEAPVAKTLRDLEAALLSARKLGDELVSVVGQARAPVVGFAQTGLPELQGLIKDMDRTVGEINRTVRDLRQDPERFLLGDPAAQGVRLQ